MSGLEGRCYGAAQRGFAGSHASRLGEDERPHLARGLLRVQVEVGNKAWRSGTAHRAGRARSLEGALGPPLKPASGGAHGPRHACAARLWPALGLAMAFVHQGR